MYVDVLSVVCLFLGIFTGIQQVERLKQTMFMKIKYACCRRKVYKLYNTASKQFLILIRMKWEEVFAKFVINYNVKFI